MNLSGGVGLTLEEVYDIAGKVIPRVVAKFTGDSIYYDSGDIVNEYMLGVMRRKYHLKMRRDKSVSNYIYVGLQNTARNLKKRHKHEEARLDPHHIDEILYNSNLNAGYNGHKNCDRYVDGAKQVHLLQWEVETAIKRDYPVKFQGTVLSVIALIFQGYYLGDVSKKLGITPCKLRVCLRSGKKNLLRSILLGRS